MEPLLESLKEAMLSRNVIAWGIAIVLFIVVLKLLQRAGKGFVLLLLFIALGFVLYRFYPGVVDPMVDFVRGGWLGEHRPFDPN